MRVVDFLRRSCRECGVQTRYVHRILRLRLCNVCEKALPKYNLIPSTIASHELGVTREDLRGLKSLLDPVTQRRHYLRAQVEELSARRHSHQSLQKLRNRRVAKMPEEDPCCFDVCGLELSDWPAEGENDSSVVLFRRGKIR